MTKPFAKVDNVTAFPLRGPNRQKAYEPEGAESSHGDVGLPADPAERQRFRELVRDAMRGGPTGRY